MNNTITNVPGLKVGHSHNEQALTGCTVVICEAGAVGGVDQRGGAPGTRETDLLRPSHLVEEVHAILLTGGSAFGLDAAGGVMQYLHERDIGYDARVARVPIVPAAVLFDLDVGDSSVRPDAQMGYAACLAASSGATAQGCVGTGIGARVGGMFGPQFATKGGLGSASTDLGSGLRVGALVAVNAFGDVLDPATGDILAGARQPPDGDTFADTLASLKATSSPPQATASNTIIGVVASNAQLNKEQTNKVAQMAQDGLAQTVRPAHTMFDGDTIFALSTGEVAPHAGPNLLVNLIGGYAAQMMAQAIVNAIHAAETMGGLPSANFMRGISRKAAE